MAEQDNATSDDLFFSAIVDAYVSLEKNPRFLRRDWLAAKINERLSAPGCRFVLLTAGPGAGKSAFLAQLAHDYPDWPRYFIRRDQRSSLADVSAKSFLLRIGYQLAALFPDLFRQDQLRLVIEQRIGSLEGEAIGAEVKRLLASPFYQKVLQIQQQADSVGGRLVGLDVEELVVDTRLLDTADLQTMALIDPAKALSKHDPGRQIVVLVDALDEIRYHNIDDNILAWLTNCPELPDNIRFVLTSRPPDVAIRTFCEKQQQNLQTLTIEPTDAYVQEDAKTYVQKLVAQEDVATVLATTVQGVAGFTRQAVSKANGNIGYLDALARGIMQALAQKDEQGRRTLQALLSLQELPGELNGLTAFFLHQIRTDVESRKLDIPVTDPTGGRTRYLEAWPAVYARILGVLAVALAPLAPAQIKALGDIVADQAYFASALNRLLQFLDPVDGRYRFYHPTVAEFLTSAETDQSATAHDLYVNPQEPQRWIAGYYWKTYSADWQKCDEYGLNNLAAHLLGGNDDRIYDLISKQWMAARYAGRGRTYGSFLDDVNLAWQAALAKGQPGNLVPLVRLQTARQVVGIEVSAYNDSDLQTLVWLGREREALGNVRLRAEPEKACVGLLTVYDTLKTRGRADAALLYEAHDAARIIANGEAQADALTALAAALAQARDDHAAGVFEEARAAAGAIQDTFQRGAALNKLADALAKSGCYDEAFDVASMITNAGWLAAALRNLIPATAGIGTGQVSTLFEKAHQAARDASPGFRRVTALSTLGGALAEASDGRAQAVLDEAMAVARQLPEDEGHPSAAQKALRQLGRAILRVDSFIDQGHLFSLAKALVQADRYDEAHAVARNVSGNAARAEALARVAVALAQAGDGRATAVFNEAQAVARAAAGDNERAIALAVVADALAGFLAKTGRYDEAVDLALSIADDDGKINTLRSLATGLAQAGNRRAGAVFDEAHTAAGAIADGKSRDLKLYGLAFTLIKAGYYDKAGDVARSIADGNERAGALSALAAALAQAGDSCASAVFDEAHKITQAPQLDLSSEIGLAGMVAALAQARRYDAARRVAGVLRNDNTRIEALCALATALAQAGDEQAGMVFAEARDRARAIREKSSRREGALRVLAAALARAGRYDEARAMAQAIQDDALQGLALQAVVAALAQVGRYDEAQATARTIRNGARQAQVLQRVAAALARAGLYDQARTIAGSLQKEWRALPLSDLAVALAVAQRYDEASSVIRSIEDDGLRARALSALAGAMAKAGIGRAGPTFAEARELAAALPEDKQRARALGDVAATYLAQAGGGSAGTVFAEAIGAARSIGGDDWLARHDRDQALTYVATSLAAAGRGDQARDVVHMIQSPTERTLALERQAGALAEAGDYAGALSMLPPSSLEDFLQTLSKWASSFERTQPGLAVAVLQEATGVAAWVHPLLAQGV